MLPIPHRVRSGGPHSGRPYYRSQGTAAGPQEVARLLGATSRADHWAAVAHNLVDASASSGGDCGLGVVLRVVGMPPRCGSGVVLFRSHVRVHRLRRSGAGEAVARARTDRVINGHPHVRPVRGSILQCRDAHLSDATRGHCRVQLHQGAGVEIQDHRRSSRTISPTGRAPRRAGTGRCAPGLSAPSCTRPRSARSARWSASSPPPTGTKRATGRRRRSPMVTIPPRTTARRYALKRDRNSRTPTTASTDFMWSR